MEGAIRNLVGAGKVLNCMNGAFSDKWLDVSKRCGKEGVALQVEWGQPIRPDQLRTQLSKGAFDAVTVIFQRPQGSSPRCQNHQRDATI
jgi:aspartate aminotransferase-like enzyme